MLVPPTRSCVDPGCMRRVRAKDSYIDRDLTKVSMYEVTVYTRDVGPVPGWSFSQYCERECCFVVNG
jgi:hypothetical protein